MPQCIPNQHKNQEERKECNFEKQDTETTIRTQRGLQQMME
jgi:hypothetical protein